MPDGLSRLRRRVLLTADAVGGVWQYAFDLAAGLSARGVEPVLAVLGPAASAAQRAEAEAMPGLRLVQTGLPLDWTAEGPAELDRASAGLAGLATLTGAASVHLHAPALVGAARWPVPVVVVSHSCVGTWWGAVRGGALPEDFRWRTEAARAGLHAAAAVIAPSAAHAAAVRDLYGPVPVQVVHNGRAPHPVQAARGRSVLTAGRLWDPGKGVAALDQAAPALDASVRAAGPVRAPHGEVAAFPHLELLGTLDQAAMARAFAEGSVFASMARYEPFGLAVLEAAQAGMRLVLRDIPTFRELWDGVASFVPDDAALLPALRAALDASGDGGAQARAARYTVDAMVDGTLAVHRAVGVLA